MKVDEATWAEIRRLYAETDEPAQRIALRFNVAPSTLSQRAMKEGWPKEHRLGKRVTLSPPPLSAPPPDVPAETNSETKKKRRRARKPREPMTHEERIRRLLTLIDIQLEQLEHDMTSKEHMTEQESVRAARRYDAVVGSLEKVTEIDTQYVRTGSAGQSSSADELRREIAERLERLNAQWLAQEKPR
jgi:hypothetical protein